MQELQRAGGGMTRKPPATYEDLVAVPEHLVAEIIDGELITSPRPRPRHAVATGALFAAIYDYFHRGQAGTGGWTILIEPEIHLHADVLVPDIAGWRRERMPRLPDEAWFPLAPDWICEVLSPSTAAIDRSRKLPIYAREGVNHAWVVDPIVRTVEVLRRDGAQWIIIATCANADVLRAEPFQTAAIDLRLLWEEPAA